ncbi:MAG: hypothetical protein WBC58_15475 [Maribacter stanieri]
MKIKFKNWLGFALVIFSTLGCSKTNEDKAPLLEAIIISEQDVGLFEAIVLKGEYSKGEIASYSWELKSYPDIITGELVKKYTDKVSTQTDRTLNFLSPYAGDYTFKLSIVDIEGNKDSVTKDITIASLCDENYSFDTLWTEAFETSSDWLFEIGEDDPNPDEYCASSPPFIAGISKIENNTLTIAPSTIEEFRTAKKKYLQSLSTKNQTINLPFH